eukprot:938198-Amorphochlora_amoeboformis.AAC.1
MNKKLKADGEPSKKENKSYYLSKAYPGNMHQMNHRQRQKVCPSSALMEGNWKIKTMDHYVYV